MNLKKLGFVAAGAVLLLSGCAPKTYYQWNGYSDVMYDYYQNNKTDEQMVVYLQSIIDKANESNKIVPPGIYADLGTFYLRANNPGQAIALYQMEATTWPESAELMAKLIDGVQRNVSKQSNKRVAQTEVTSSQQGDAQ